MHIRNSNWQGLFHGKLTPSMAMSTYHAYMPGLSPTYSLAQSYCHPCLAPWSSFCTLSCLPSTALHYTPQLPCQRSTLHQPPPPLCHPPHQPASRTFQSRLCQLPCQWDSRCCQNMFQHPPTKSKLFTFASLVMYIVYTHLSVAFRADFLLDKRSQISYTAPSPTWPHNSLFNGQELLCIPHLYVVSLTWASSAATDLALQLPTY